jgi:hypothetical protein
MEMDYKVRIPQNYRYFLKKFQLLENDAQKGVKWVFNSPAAPHLEGA